MSCASKKDNGHIKPRKNLPAEKHIANRPHAKRVGEIPLDNMVQND
jgi:hypothetical protein